MRLKDKTENLDYCETKRFFVIRANKYNENNPYAVTMYQDNNAELVKQRNTKEIEKLYPMLKIDQNSRILDLACGIGRWADAVQEEITEYCGVDFSEELISIANERNKRENMIFLAGSITDIDRVLEENQKEYFNRILLIGILVYINDEDLMQALHSIIKHCEEHCIVCIREPIGLQNRLTLKDFYSEELEENYNAIYRTDHELKKLFQDSFLSAGFAITHEGFLFEEDQLNNRKETAQYYYILER